MVGRDGHRFAISRTCRPLPCSCGRISWLRDPGSGPVSSANQIASVRQPITTPPRGVTCHPTPSCTRKDPAYLASDGWKQSASALPEACETGAFQDRLILSVEQSLVMPQVGCSEADALPFDRSL